MNSGKLLRITDDRSIYIHENEDGGYIDEQTIIKYRNIGASFELAQVMEAYTMVDSNQSVHILDDAGKSKFHFPAIWLDTQMMKILELQESGLIKFNN